MIEVLTMIIILIAFLFIAPIMMHKILYLFAKISYKIAHRNTHQSVQNRREQNKTEIIFNLGDTKNMILTEIVALKKQMRKILGGI